MNRRLFGASLLLAAFVALEAPQAFGQKDTKGGDPKAGDTTIDSDKIAPGIYSGTMKSAPDTDRMFTLEVETTRIVPDGKPIKPAGGAAVAGALQNVLRQQTQLQQAQAQLATARTAQAKQQAATRVRNATTQLQNALAQYQRAATPVLGPNGLPQGYKYDTVKNTVEFQASETVKVRTLLQPEEFDEKGEIIKPDAKKIAEWKGKDKKLPGYESSLEKLEPGQKVRVWLGLMKKTTPKSPPKDSEKDKEEEKAAAKAKQAVLIIILADGDKPSSPGEKKKKK
jgi:hypothetical protein